MPKRSALSHQTEKNRCVLAYLTWSTPSLWHGIRAYARDAGWHLISPEHYYGPPKPSKRVDGVILLADPNRTFDVRRYFPNAKIVDLLGDKEFQADGWVFIDHEKVGRLAAEYLHSLGRKHYLVLTLTTENLVIDSRMNAFRQRLKELYRGASEAYTCQAISYEGLVRNSSARSRKQKREMADLIGKAEPPIAAFCPDDYVADVFLQEVIGLGFRVPEDIAILGVNNNRGFCELSQVPLSSIDVNLSRLGHDGAELLDHILDNDQKVPRKLLIPPLTIEKRRSTEQLVCDDKIVQSILTYINDHYMERITADDIIHDVHASRTNAFIRFRQHMGRSIGQEIERVRLANAQSLLETTDYKIDAIARMSGYMNTSAFCRTFKKSIGQTPTEYRSVACQFD